MFATSKAVIPCCSATFSSELTRSMASWFRLFISSMRSACIRWSDADWLSNSAFFSVTLHSRASACWSVAAFIRSMATSACACCAPRAAVASAIRASRFADATDVTAVASISATSFCESCRASAMYSSWAMRRSSSSTLRLATAVATSTCEVPVASATATSASARICATLAASVPLVIASNSLDVFSEAAIS